MQVLIIGAGLGGLTAALTFAQHGHEVCILERRSALSPQGGSIMIRSGACSMLHTLGLEADLERMSDRVPMTLVRNMEVGEVIKRYPVEVTDTPAWGTTRQEVMKLLYRKVLDAGVRIRFGHFVVDLRDEVEDEQPYVELDNGTHIHGDIILVADGIKSKLRAKILPPPPTTGPSPFEPLISDTTFYGLTVDVSELRKHTGTARLIDQTDVNIWKGPRGYVVSRNNNKTKQVSLLYGVQCETDQKDLWDEDGDIDYVRGHFAGSCTEVTVPLQIAKSCDRWRLAEMPQLPTWRSRTGRAVLLGDSAHAMHPNAGQGYSQIVEDIGVLSFLVHEGMKGEPIPEVTRMWLEIRMPRVERISRFSNWKTQWFSGEMASSTGPGGWGEDASSLKDVFPSMDAAFQTSSFLKWVLDFDVTAEAKQYLRQGEALSVSSPIQSAA